MTQSSSSFTPQEFQGLLGTDEVDSPLRLTGMAKASDDSTTDFMFVVGTRCTTWTAVPLEMIETVDVLGTVPCDDHAHHRVTLTLKEPQSAEAAAYAGLLRAGGAASAAGRRTVRKPGRGSRSKSGATDFLSGYACSELEIDADGTVWELVDVVEFEDGSTICTYQHG